MNIRLLTTPAHPCSYLPEQLAQTQFLEPDLIPDASIYQAVIDQGFRRTGRHLYRPACGDCSQCRPMRIPVAEFRPNRQQRRALQKVSGRLEVQASAFGYESQQYLLYERYLKSRHADGDMANPTPDGYLEFLAADWCKTLGVALYLDGQLMALAVTDLLPRGLSAVYTFFEPGLEAQSPGVLAILSQVSLAQDLGLAYLYLGYWIPGCRKMAYKSSYRPHQIYINGDWLSVAG